MSKAKPTPSVRMDSRALKQRKQQSVLIALVALSIGTLYLASNAKWVSRSDTGQNTPNSLENPDGQQANALPSGPPPITYPRAMEVTVQGGDTLISLLTNVGISRDEAHGAVESIRKIYDPRKLNVGQTLSVEIDKDQVQEEKIILASLTIPTSITTTIELKRQQDAGYAVEKIEAPVTRKLVRGGGKITSSLYETGISNGISASALIDVINAYSYDVDFQRDIQSGHSIDVLYEQLQLEDGSVASTGDVLYAELVMGKKRLKIYRYTDKNGDTDFFNEKGESVRKALLRTPVPGARISSRFGKRKHPILGYTKMHRGIDFAAPTGTPIYAAGDGVVTFAGRKGGYGNYLRIKHNGTYSTAYAHISRFGKNMRNGKKVKQGDIVAYVGTTGRSTGPHLHYEILKFGSQVNPSGVKFKTGTILAGAELKKFQGHVTEVHAKLDDPNGEKKKLAAASSTKARQ